MGFLIQGTILLALLWIMIKVQRLNYTFLGLLGSTVLASGLDMIPYAGHFLAVPALYFCIWKVTGSPIFTDAAITVVISYALMFCLNFFVVGAFKSYLRSAHHPSDIKDSPQIEASKSNRVSEAHNPALPAITNLVQTIDEKQAAEIAGKFVIKGVTRNGDKSTVTIQSVKKVYVISLNQSVSVQTDDGPVSVSLTELNKDWVILKIKGTQVIRQIPLK